MMWYGIGQGSSFLVQAFARNNSSADVQASIAIYYSLFSLCFQFSDFGNVGYLVGAQKKGNIVDVHSFVVGRVIFAACVLIIIVIFNKDGVNYRVPVEMLAVVLAATAMQFSLVDLAKIEANLNYFKVGLVQSAPWIISSGFVIFVLIFNLIDAIYGIIIWISVIFFYIKVFKLSYVINYSGIKINKVIESYVYVVPPIIGQLWGREMLYIVANKEGVAALAAMAIVRNIHTFGSLVTIFAIRPLLAKILTGDGNILKNTQVKIIIICGCIFSAISAVIFWKITHENKSELMYWAPLVCGVPLWGISYIYMTAIQNNCSPRSIVFVDISGFILHSVGFFALLGSSPAWAFLAADFCRVIFICISANYLMREKYYE